VLLRVRVLVLLLMIVMASTLTPGISAEDNRSLLAERVITLTRDTRWTLASRIVVAFKTFHPQGMVKIGDTYIVSSVEVRVPPKRLPAAAAADGHDRDTGEGVGHLFKINGAGELLADVKLGEGTIYHPGGIDFDGTNIWVPVAEYRPHSRSIVYRVSPETMTVTKMFTVDDHIGAIVHDRETNTLHGVSWGSRRFYSWTDAGKETQRRENPSHYIDYQDCKSIPPKHMLCTGLADLRRAADTPAFRLGGLELIDLADGRPIHQVPLLLWTTTGLPMTQNPSWFEPTATGLRAFFMPEDDNSTIYIYDVGLNAQ
jgi:hypothetical protein